MSLSDTLREAFLPERSAHADRLPRRLLREISRMPRLTGILPYVAWQEETRLFALDQGGLRRTRIAGHRFLHRGLAANRRQRRNGEGAGQSLRLLPAGDRHPGHLYGSPNILPVLRAQANLLPRSGRDVMPPARPFECAGKIAVTTTSSACSRGGASITTCTVPDSQFFRIRPICYAIFGG
jgi:hypothetical protein